MTINYSDFNTTAGEISKVISAYADEARADASLILSSGLATADARVSDAGEGFTGVIRWLGYNEEAITTFTKPGVSSDEGTLNQFLQVDNYSEVYVKNVDSVAAKENSIQSLVSKVDGLSFLGRQFGAVRARREDKNLRAILKGVALDVLNSDNDGNASAYTVADGAQAISAGKRHTFGYVTEFNRTAGATDVGTWDALFSNEETDKNRSKFFDILLNAMSDVSGEFEESFYYLVISPAVYNVLRKQNVLDINPVQDGNITISTLLGGKIRLIVTGNAGLSTGTYSNVALAEDSTGDNTYHEALQVSYLMKPGALFYANVGVNNPTAIDTNPLTNRGFGDVSIVSRWGNIIHPRGYSASVTDAFSLDSALATSASWTRKATNVNQTGIFPIFHGTADGTA